MGGTISGSVSYVSATTAEVTGKFKVSSSNGSYNHDLKLKVTVDGQTNSGTRDLKSGGSVSISKTVDVTRGTSAKTITIKGHSATGTAMGTINKSTTVTVAARPYYTISYRANGGHGAPDSQGHYHGYSVTITSKEPSRTGYNFKGWGTYETDTSVAYRPGSTYSKNESDVLYAIWDPKSVSINFYANGGKFSNSSTSYKTSADYNSTFKFNKASTPTRTGYTFKGWGTSSTATSVKYTGSSSMSINQTSAYSFYAIWTPNVYTYTFDSNEGYFVNSELISVKINKNFNETIDLNAANLQVEKNNYELIGWALNKISPLGFGELPSIPYLLPSESITVNSTNSPTYYAIWRLAWRSPSIAYNEQNNNEILNENNFEALRCKNSSIVEYDESSHEARRISDLIIDDEGGCAYVGFIATINQENSTIKDFKINIPAVYGSIYFNKTWSVGSILPNMQINETAIIPDVDHSSATPQDPGEACFVYIKRLDEISYDIEVIINNNYDIESSVVGSLIINDCIIGVVDIPVSSLNLNVTIPSSLFIVDIGSDGRSIAVGKVANKTVSPLVSKAFESSWPIYGYDKIITSGANNGMQFNYSEESSSKIQIYMSSDGHFTIIKI